MNTRIYPIVFMAAALYNFAFGAIMLAKPALITRPLQLAALQAIATDYPWLWRTVAVSILGMCGVYLWSATHPDRARWPITLGLLTKLIPPLCWIAAVVAGMLPLSALLLPLMNDVIWWPAFVRFLAEKKMGK